ncbi:RNA-splicing factor [Coniosporium tulheliwenetii]|uniref:RNA-splicing factor n=1 Tax=Coniosporium tulheliwenetii TaxID=3383036 RepID=A0ACC2YWW7_9PEZI|nr:RNA-splicing factor [Cladosporium sp. JES 115]
MADTATAAPLFKKRAKKNIVRKAAATPPAQSDSEYSSSEDESGHRVKRRRKTGALVSASSANQKTAADIEGATKFAADRSANIESTNDATKQSNWYDETAKDALSAQNLLGKTRQKPDAEAGSDGTYKGAANYQSFIEKNPNAPQRQVGPVKAPTNIRTITVTDFAPDVCKDYKQTGFCGFGDSCKFLHAREDYKQGWELDRDWEIGTKGKKVAGQTVASANRGGKTGDDDDEDDALLEKIPFACIICKKPYKNPIVTKCGHYFCEACALQRYRKNPSCAACGAGTGGVFNGAKNLQKLLDKKRERAKKRKEQAKEEGQEVSDDNEDDAEED